VAQWRERLRWPLPIALTVIAAICLPLGVVLNTSALAVVGVFAAIVGGILLLDAFGWTTDPILRPQDPAEVRVKRLLDALAETTKVIGAVESEVAARSKLAERLQKDIARHRERRTCRRQRSSEASEAVSRDQIPGYAVHGGTAVPRCREFPRPSVKGSAVNDTRRKAAAVFLIEIEKAGLRAVRVHSVAQF
jgi:hypothetical protein